MQPSRNRRGEKVKAREPGSNTCWDTGRSFWVLKSHQKSTDNSESRTFMYTAIHMQACQCHHNLVWKQIMKSSSTYGCLNKALDTVVFPNNISQQHLRKGVNNMWILQQVQNGNLRLGTVGKPNQNWKEHQNTLPSWQHTVTPAIT